MLMADHRHEAIRKTGGVLCQCGAAGRQGQSSRGQGSKLVMCRSDSRTHCTCFGALYGAVHACSGQSRLHNSVCREAWYLEIGSGHHWLAHRVPHDAFFVTGNQGRFKASCAAIVNEARAPRAPRVIHAAKAYLRQGQHTHAGSDRLHSASAAGASSQRAFLPACTHLPSQQDSKHVASRKSTSAMQPTCCTPPACCPLRLQLACAAPPRAIRLAGSTLS